MMITQNSSELRWLWREMRPYLRWQIGSLVFITLGSLLSLLDPLVMKWLIDVILPARNLHALYLSIGLIFFAYAGRAVLSTVGTYFSFIGSQRFILNLRLRLLTHLTSLSAEYHETTPVGTTLYLVRDTVQEIAVLGSDMFPTMLRTVVMGVCVLTTMFVLNARLTTVILPLIPVFLLMNRRLRRELRSKSDTAQIQQTNASAILQEHVASMTQIQMLSCERKHTRRVFHHLAAGVRAEYWRKRAEIRYSILSNSVLVAGMMAILGYGGFQVMKGALSIGGLVAFYSYLVRLFEPLYMAVEMGSRFQRIGASIRRLDAIFQIGPSVANAPDARPLPQGVRGHLQVRAVTFAFQDGTIAIRDVDFEVEPRERVALVGPNGAGKSTLAKLLVRIYDVQGGSIAIDDRDVRKVRLDSLRSHVAYIPQEPVLFDCTLAENLLIARPGATAEELSEVMEITRLSAMVGNSQRDWKAPLGPRGNRLSAGERQRVALARILLRKPTILVLDEATSALDASTERLVLEHLDSLLPHTTLILITHRLSAITWVNRIFVLNNGRIVEAGHHTNLYALKGLYAELYDHPTASDRRIKAVS